MIRRLRVGTDYSGMETPIIALKCLGVDVNHIFSSEIDPKARHLILELFKPGALYSDVLLRDPSFLPKNLDLYVAGFPCQAFSSINRLAGKNRSEPVSNHLRPLRHFFACLETISVCKPSVFVLENLPALVNSKSIGSSGPSVRSALGRLKSYNVSYLVLNARDYGSPQNRKRLFIVGIRRSVCPHTGFAFDAPPRANTVPTFESILEKRAKRKPLGPGLKRTLEACARQHSRPVFLNPTMASLTCKGSAKPSCLTRGGGGVYWTKRGIRTTLREDMRLQGIPDSFNFPAWMSETSARRIIGNAMSVDVLRNLFRMILEVLATGERNRQQLRVKGREKEEGTAQQG